MPSCSRIALIKADPQVALCLRSKIVPVIIFVLVLVGYKYYLLQGALYAQAIDILMTPTYE